MADGDPKTALVAIHLLWHEWTDPKDHRPEAKAFLDEYKSCLDTPSPVAFTVGLLSDHRPPSWTADEWAVMAAVRRAARLKGKEPPLPAAVDALIQLEAADQLEGAGRHDEAVLYPANAVEESPGQEDLLVWEARVVAGDHDPNFNCHEFLLGRSVGAKEAEHEVEDQPDETGAAEPSPSG